MAIELITGKPGSGKTLYTINAVKRKAEKEGRPVYYYGIKDLALPWFELEDPAKWYECPPNSIIVIDECQRVFRPRPQGQKVPEHVSRLETHRHQGLDLYLITQLPRQADTHIRGLCERHFHVVRKFGLQAATVHEFSECRDDADRRRTGSVRHDFRYPKASYQWYKSAEVHTHKAHVPMRVYVLIAIPLLLAACAWGFIQWQKKTFAGAESAASKVVGAPASGAGVLPVPAVAMPAASDADKWMSERVPRVQGMAWTAPRYDGVLSVASAPLPRICVASSTRCACYTDQGTKLDVSEELCRDLSQKGFYDDSARPPGGHSRTPATLDRVQPGQSPNGA